jgi:hypothetical protein
MRAAHIDYGFADVGGLQEIQVGRQIRARQTGRCRQATVPEILRICLRDHQSAWQDRAMSRRERFKWGRA